ncbi:MAG TPA: tRNA (adenosine(37)-N6)-threonylcarbamoyltransferase complex dimerization subunit type 1 TsaB, partial [Candidatus Eisenbacteria bacterium]|nr:tRNA (adenosine(37)-N6)-threonylcarbamoyltransferase complex dimerization subunit type 1 TsaB [Candidatus Eisenbacteria bacterium]
EWTRQRDDVPLLARLEALMARAGSAAADLSAVAAARGPGSFTGIRLGLGLALGIASGRGVALFLLDSLRALSAQAPRDGPPAGALRDAGRGEVYAWRPTVAPARIATTSLPGWIQADDRLVVDPPGALAEWSPGQAAWEVPSARRRSMLEALADEANRVMNHEKPVRYHEVEAMYVQPAAAEERRSR